MAVVAKVKGAALMAVESCDGALPRSREAPGARVLKGNRLTKALF